MHPLLQATLDQPTDAGVHAVYADWLIAHGSALGSVIQAELAGLTGLPLARRYAPFIDEILGPLAPFVAPVRIRWGRAVRGLLRSPPSDRDHPYWRVLDLQGHVWPSPVPPRFVFVTLIAHGIDHRFWLAWDRAQERTLTLAIGDHDPSGARELDSEARFYEIYLGTLDPLPPEPWSKPLASAVASVRRRVENDRGHVLHPRFHTQCFLMNDHPLLIGSPLLPDRLPSGPPVPSTSGWAAFQSRGSQRLLNEDGWFVDRNCLVVLDGMGGSGPGDTATWNVARAFVDAQDQPLADRLIAHPLPLVEGDSAGCCAVALQLHSGGAQISWIGNCRAYRFRVDGLEQITRDHTLAMRRVDAGEITPEQACTHPHRNVLLRALGIEDQEITTLHLPLQAQDRLLLCTDGLYETLPASEISHALTAATPALAVQELARAFHARVSRDNVALIVVDPEAFSTPR